MWECSHNEISCICGVVAKILPISCYPATTFFISRMGGIRLCEADIDPPRACLHAYAHCMKTVSDSSDISQHDMFDHTTDSMSQYSIKTAQGIFTSRHPESHQGTDLPGCVAHAIQTHWRLDQNCSTARRLSPFWVERKVCTTITSTKHTVT